MALSGHGGMGGGMGAGMTLIPPLLIRAIIDTAIPHHNFQLAILLGCGLILFPVGGAILGLAQNYLSIVIAQGLIADLREHLYRHLQALGLEFFTWTRSGEIHSRFLNDAGALQNVLSQSFFGTFANIITLVGALVVMAAINWQLALLAALALPAFTFPVLHFGHRRYTAIERAQAALGELSVSLEETLSLSGTIVVKSFGTEEREAARFSKVNDRVRKDNICYGFPDAAEAEIEAAVEAERRIQAALEMLVEGRTTVAIAHRLSTIQRADQILVVQEGRIVERGTHEALLRQSGLYQRLYEAQFASQTVSETPSAAPPS